MCQKSHLHIAASIIDISKFNNFLMLWSRKIILGQNILSQCRIKLLQCFSIPLPEWSYFNLICILRLLLANQIPIFLAKSAREDDCGIKPHQFGVPKQFKTKILSKKVFSSSAEANRVISSY